MGAAQPAHAEQLGDAGASSDVGLENVDRSGLEHPLEVDRVIAVFAGGDLHPGGRAVAQEPQAFEVVGGHGLLEPAHAGVVREAPREVERLLARVGAVGVDEQARIRADRPACCLHALGIAVGLRTDLHLHSWNPLLDPAAQLGCETIVRVRGEPPRAVDGNAIACHPEQLAQRQAQARAP